VDGLPLIDVAALAGDGPAHERAVLALAGACERAGFFYAVEHGVSRELQERLERVSRAFFALPMARKLEIEMARGGRAWRGYFPVGAELTSGRPDIKEGLYFGAELGPDDPRVRAGLPMHGANVFPAELPELRAVVLEYIDVMTALGHRLMAGIALSLGLERDYFASRYTADPLILFRIFRYPAMTTSEHAAGSWSVGEHTDYGLLTILAQDHSGGLEVQVGGRWIAVEPIPNAFVCNIGDMLDRVTGGRYRSTPHRVRYLGDPAHAEARLSFPFFFDPNFASRVHAIDGRVLVDVDADRAARWDRASVHELGGTYGDYLLSKVAKVFPQLVAEVA
jgi:isopenicillin N synthase-like dioxygenase